MLFLRGTMKNIFRILFLTTVLSSILLTSFADRGIGKKSKTKAVLNIKMPTNFRSALNFNLKNGLKYNGSLISTHKNIVTGTTSTHTLITYQKGNTVYILPYKQKLVVGDYKQGFAGAKLVISLR
jgi:hypothetical protein